ncbi:hypothetical protein PIB30_085496 [Stylosanthes scabra]|uniref:Uncharacterized protein n=1 Tax=Stylosanthes scabra TaxID=79078 RepID=A0ABU6TSB5_9FABA|nr:hypothetical protein [Stylosanthes scabra]
MGSSVTSGEKRQNAAARYGSSIVARPPPLWAIVLPWDRKGERRTVEVDGLTMVVEDGILGRRNMLRRGANDEAERGEAAAVSGFSQMNGVWPGFLLMVGGFAAASPKVTEA